MERKISEKINEDGIHLDPDINDDMKQMIEDATESVHQTHQPHSLQCLFWEQQKKASSLTDRCSMKWHSLIIKWCLYLRHISSKGYELLRQRLGA